MKSLYDTGELQGRDGAWVFGDALRNESESLPVPESMRAILQRRLQALGKTPREVFAALAVWEREAAVQDLAYLTGFDEEMVAASLDALQHRRLVGGALGGRGRGPALVHEKLAAAALRAVPEGVVRQFHIRSSELAEQSALQGRGRASEWSVAARHAAAAGDAERAALNAARAAAEVERARGRDAALETLGAILDATPRPIRDELEAALKREGRWEKAREGVER